MLHIYKNNRNSRRSNAKIKLDKSGIISKQQITFLGVIINSLHMTITLTNKLWNCVQLIPLNSPRFETSSFNGYLPVSWFPFFILPFLSQNNTLLLFQNNHANQVYLLYLLHTVKRGVLGQFFKFLFILSSSIPLLPCCFWRKKHLALHAQLSRSGVLLRTHDMLQKLNIGGFGKKFSGWLWTVKNIFITFKIWLYLLLQSDLLALQIAFVHVLISCKFQFPWIFSFLLAWG